jgi:uncharacterized metal-binding protein
MNQVKETTQTNARILTKIRFKMQIKITKIGQQFKTALSREAHISQKTLCRKISRENTCCCVCVKYMHVYKNKKINSRF